MIGTRGLARTLIAGTFVAGGVAAWKRSAKLAPAAEDVVAPVESALGRAVDTEPFVKANAAVQVVAGGLFALGVAPRPMALVLGASLVPTTIAGHAFWDVDDPAPTEPEVTLEYADEKLAGAGGCNRYFAPAKTGAVSASASSAVA